MKKKFDSRSKTTEKASTFGRFPEVWV